MTGDTTTWPLNRALVWFRRDLRDFDHAALGEALRRARHVFCAFVFDREILDALPDRTDRRVEFIVESVRELANSLRARGGELILRHGQARDIVPALAQELQVEAVFANRDYEPDAVGRDAAVADALATQGITYASFKDQVIFERSEILSQSRKPFAVFTPYRNAWLAALSPGTLAAHPVEQHASHLARPPAGFLNAAQDLDGLGFARTNLSALPVPTGMSGGSRLFADFRRRIDRYREQRDYPALKGPSYLSVHLRFGTVSIRELAAFAHARSLEPGGEGAATWLGELIWRDFYAQVLHHRPDVVLHAFKPEFDRIAWTDDPGQFDAWCRGATGYPLVDAAMRQLNGTGYMHNRLRMISASFLVKDLHVDWRNGERYFARKLIDYDLASNNGGWQWAASTGCDAQPYFRIFNPVTQSLRFDPDGLFIRRYLPEIAGLDSRDIHAPWTASGEALRASGIFLGRTYPLPIVDHARARAQTLALFAAARRA